MFLKHRSATKFVLKLQCESIIRTLLGRKCLVPETVNRESAIVIALEGINYRWGKLPPINLKDFSIF